MIRQRLKRKLEEREENARTEAKKKPNPQPAATPMSPLFGVTDCGLETKTHSGSDNESVQHSETKLTTNKLKNEAARRFRESVEAQGGSVIGTYVGREDRVECICKNKHPCWPIPASIRDGASICPTCSGTEAGAAERRFRAEVESQGGTMIGPYVRRQDPIECECKFGHSCFPAPQSLASGSNMCFTCAGTDPVQAERKFRNLADEMGWTVLGNYESGHTPIECECPNGHACTTRPSKFKFLKGCRICDGKDSESSERRFRESIAALGGRVIGTYVRFNDPIECICPKNHKCHPSPKSIQIGGGMCRRCAGNDPEAGAERFHDCVEALGGKVVGQYVNAKTSVECICINLHKCFPVPDKVVRRHSICKECKGLKGEGHFGSLLNKLGEPVVPRFCLPEVKGARDWPFDFKIGKCIFEFDGPQHFRPYKLFGGLERFESYQRPRDLVKTEGALTNGYRMVRVHYEWIGKREEDKLKFLRDALKSNIPLIVSEITRYQWLADAGFCPSELPSLQPLLVFPAVAPPLNRTS